MVRETRHLWVGNLPESVREDRIREHFKRSTEEVSPPNFEQRSNSYYDRSSRLAPEPDQYIRRPNNYHASDVRGRARDRLYRNGPYSSMTDRTTAVGHHRVSNWYDSSPSGTSTLPGQSQSPSTRSVYGNVASAVVQPDTSNYDCQLLKKKKSRSGSESPCGASNSVNATSSHSSHIVDRGNGGSAASSRSHSRSPSSCSSTNSTSSNSHASSPVSGSDPPLSSSSTRTRNLQSAVSAPIQSSMTISNQILSGNAGSSSSSSTGNPVVHSEDNRPLAICVRNLPARSSDTSLKDGLFHEYKKHGKVTWVKVVGQNAERYALVCFKKPDDVEKALEVSHDKLFFGCKIEVAPYQGYDVEDNEFRPYEAELDEYHPKSTRTLFIGNLEKDITGSELRKHFECFGEIIEIDIKKQGLNAYAFCQYSDIVSVVKAMRKMDGEHLGNNRIKLGFGKSMPTNCVWIDGIADSVSENYLSGQFSRYGVVSQVVIDRERKLALVSFEQIQYAQSAVKEMRGATLRGRKLQVDFASRECQEAFYDKLDKQASGSSGSSNPTECTNLIVDETTCHVVSVPGTRFGRYDSQSRSRTSSFSRHSNINSSGATSPSSVSGSVGTSNISGSNTVVGGSSTPRGGRSRGLRHSDYEYADRRIRVYDEYSQGSAASHDDETYNYVGGVAREARSDSPQSRLGPSSGTAVDTLDVNTSGSGRRRCDKSPGDIRNLQKERFHLLEQLEECPSSGDELVSPKKRMKFDHSSHHHNHHHTISSLAGVNNAQHHQTTSTQFQPAQQQSQQQQTHQLDCPNNSNSNSLPQANVIISDPNCDVINNHSNDSTIHHRKCVEVRRLSECSSLKYASQLNSSSSSNSRRPSIESGVMLNSLRHVSSGTGNSSIEHNVNTTVYATPHSVSCKRRRTGNTVCSNVLPSATDANEYHSSRGRGHQLHSHHSHEASGGESADGSRPGTPLCDERPEVLPSEPRRIPREKSHEPMMLPLPKFGIQFFQQNRTTNLGATGTPSLTTIASGTSSHIGQLYPISSSSSSTNISHNSSTNNNNNNLSNSSNNVSNSVSINCSNNNLLNTNSSSALLNSGNSSHSSLRETLSSPPLLIGTRLSSSSFHHPTQTQSTTSSSHYHNTSSSLPLPASSSYLVQSQQHHHHSRHHHHHHHGQSTQHFHHSISTSSGSTEQAPSSPLRAHSLSSNSSDSEMVPMSTSPSIEERIKTLDEMLEIWSGGGNALNRSHSLNSDSLSHNSCSYTSRHKFLDLDVNEVKPSDIVKSVLAKKSIFDDDLQRLKNISDKYEPGDFSNLSRSSLISSTSPGIPNLAATKTPVVGGSSINKQASQTSIFQSPGVNQLQRMNSPMNSPQAMSPYNSPSPSPVITSGVNSKQSLLVQQGIVTPQPAKGLQYPFPSHPPVNLNLAASAVPPSLCQQSTASAAATMNTVTPVTQQLSASQSSIQQSQTKLATNEPFLSTKPKTNTITKSFSLQEKSPSSTNTILPSNSGITATPNLNRVLCKSASVPGSTNVGTVRTASVIPALPVSNNSNNINTVSNSNNSSISHTTNVPNSKYEEESESSTTGHNLRRGSADSSSSKSAYSSKSSNLNISKKTEKSHKHNHRNDSEKNISKSEKYRSDSTDKRKSHEDHDDAESHCRKETDRHQQDEEKSRKEQNSRDQQREIDRERERLKEREREKEQEKERDRLEKERLEHKKWLKQEKEKIAKRREKEEREKEERETKEREEREKREREERERKQKELEIEKERQRKEKEEREQRERETRERAEREEKERKEEKARKEREELERKQRQDMEMKEREEKARKEREEHERKVKQEHERKLREEQERKMREDHERKMKEEHERKLREEQERRQREEQERKLREEHERKLREEQERKAREEHERKVREEQERKAHEDEERKAKEEQERRNKEEQERKAREELERKMREDNERKSREELERKAREEHERKRSDTHEDSDVVKYDESSTSKNQYGTDGDNLPEPKRHLSTDSNAKEMDSAQVNDMCNSEERQDVYDRIRKSHEDDGRTEEKFSKDEEFFLQISSREDKDSKECNEKIFSSEDYIQKRRERNSGTASPGRASKRRLSSQDSIENEESSNKRCKTDGDSRKVIDRRDSKEPSRPSKHHKSHSRASSISKHNEENKNSSTTEERYRKDSGFEEKKCKDKEHKKDERERSEKSSTHKYKHKVSNKEDKDFQSSHIEEKDINDIRSSSEKTFDPSEVRSTDEEEEQRHQHRITQQEQQQHHHHRRNKKEHKEKKQRHEYDEESSHRQPPGTDHRRSDSRKHESRHAERKSSVRSDDGPSKQRTKPPRKLTQSSNDSDSDEPKKHSIFDILDDGPYVSMYDKVKARSCKNMQKQEEEKKIKAKFTQLKQSRAKREEKKRSTSYDGDSDSDFDDRHTKFKHNSFKSARSCGFVNSSSDEGTMLRNKENLISDSDSDARRMQYNRARLNELCDGDSSESGLVLAHTAPRKKISVKRNSRIASDSSDAETQPIRCGSSNREIQMKSETSDNEQSDKKELKVKTEIKTEDEETVEQEDMSLKREPFDMLKEESLKNEVVPHTTAVKIEIKTEPQEMTGNFYNMHTNSLRPEASESETNVCASSTAESKDNIFDHLFSQEIRKKHKKSKKRQKISSLASTDADNSATEHCDEIKTDKTSPRSLEHVFDELKRESISLSTNPQFSEKKKHKDRKEKKRDKSREEYDKVPLTKEEKHRLKKAKKSSKLESERYNQDNTSIPQNFSMTVKRGGEKMEDIFGPISDEESQYSPSESAPKDPSRIFEPSSIYQPQPVVSAALIQFKQEPLTPKSHTVEENEENKQRSSSHSERERHRKEKREKKRKERERTREQHALSLLQQKVDDENSVDLDEAGRALEAQLMEDSDNKFTEETTPSTANTQKSDVADVFRFSDGDENSMEVVTCERKEVQESHKTKEKKKKKKRSKEERHQRREHHHHNSSNHSSSNTILPSQNPNKLSIEITSDVAEEITESSICKPSPSLPCLLDESPPHKSVTASSDITLSISPLVRDTNSISPISKVPSLSALAKPVECKKKPDKFIPGFDVELDEKISESAVQSISAELTSPAVESIKEDSKLPIPSPPEMKNSDKIEEKSRVIISQEETEDAVAALLGESFGTSGAADYSFAEDSCGADAQVEEEDTNQVATEPVIPEEEAEEMRKAVQSLSNEEMDLKADTPQSEQDLQIDTDTEEQEEEPSNRDVISVKNPVENEKNVETRKSEDVKAVAATSSNEDIKPAKIDEKQLESLHTTSVITKNLSEIVEKSKESLNEIEPKQPQHSASDQLNEKGKIKIESDEKEASTTTPVIQTTFAPVISVVSHSTTSTAAQHQTTSVQTTTTSQLIYGSTQTRSTQPQTKVTVRSQSGTFTVQPPTISIPEQSHFIYPPINVMVSPRGLASDHRISSPRVQSGQNISQQPSQIATIRSSSPHSPSIQRGGTPVSSQTSGIRQSAQLSPVISQHVVLQQRQLMSPPNSVQSQSSPNIVTSSNQGNIVLNRIPVKPVLTSISKPIQPTSVALPQSNTAKSSVVHHIDSKETKTIGQQTITYSSVRISPTTTPSISVASNNAAGRTTPTKVLTTASSAQNQQSLKLSDRHHPSGDNAVVQSVGTVHITSTGKPQTHQTIMLQTQHPINPTAQPQRLSQSIQQTIQSISPQMQTAQPLGQPQSQQPIMQHHIIQQRQQQQKQMHPQQQQMQNKAPQQQRISHSQVVQMHQYQQQHQQQALPQTNLSKDNAQKVNNSSSTANVQSLTATKDVQTSTPVLQNRMQPNVVLVRQQATQISLSQQQIQSLTQSQGQHHVQTQSSLQFKTMPKAQSNESRTQTHMQPQLQNQIHQQSQTQVQIKSQSQSSSQTHISQGQIAAHTHAAHHNKVQSQNQGQSQCHSQSHVQTQTQPHIQSQIKVQTVVQNSPANASITNVDIKNQRNQTQVNIDSQSHAHQNQSTPFNKVPTQNHQQPQKHTDSLPQRQISPPLSSTSPSTVAVKPSSEPPVQIGKATTGSTCPTAASGLPQKKPSQIQVQPTQSEKQAQKDPVLAQKQVEPAGDLEPTNSPKIKTTEASSASAIAIVDSKDETVSQQESKMPLECKNQGEDIQEIEEKSKCSSEKVESQLPASKEPEGVRVDFDDTSLRTDTSIADKGNEKPPAIKTALTSKLEVKTNQKSLLTEENVTKLSPPPEEDEEEKIEIDSKEDSDYWSAKEVNIESVIKKVDALCSNDEIDDLPQTKSMVEDKPKEESDEHDKDTTESKEKDVMKTESADIILDKDKNEDTNDEEEFDEGVPESADSAKHQRGGKRGRIGRGTKKITSIPIPGSPSLVGSVGDGMQTRRAKGGSHGIRGKRGRGGATKSVNSVPTLGERKMRSQVSDQDVYEFHEDSGEENISTKSSERPRLILTIKSPGQATTTVVQTKSVPAPNAVATTINTSVSMPLQPAAIGGEAAAGHQQKEDFSAPAANIRKSRRLQEKDGGNRNTVDDTIEDVVRNLTTSPKTGGQTPPRRSTRNAQNNPTGRGTNSQSTDRTSQSASEVRKSPRANRRTKDRKASETSVDSSDEKVIISMRNEEKSASKSAVDDSSEEFETDKNKAKDIDDSKSNAIVPTNTLSSSKENDEKIPMASKSGDATEPLTLIDPVTGLLTVVRQSKEGQYVPVPGANDGKATVGKGVINKPSSVAVPSVNSVEPLKNISTIEPQAESLIQQQPKMNTSIAESAVVTSNSSSNNSSITHKQTSVVVTPAHHPTSTATTAALASTASSQSTLNIQQIQHQQPQHQTSTQQTTQIRTHPLKAHVLNSQLSKPVVAQTVTKLGSNTLGQTAPVSTGVASTLSKQPVSIVQSNIVARQIQSSSPQVHQVAHSTQNVQQQQQAHLSVNVASTGSTHSAGSVNATHSPRMQHTIGMKQQQLQQPTPSSQQPTQVLHVVTKGNGPHPHMHQQQSQHPHQPIVIHTNKIQQSAQGAYTSVVQGTGKIVQQSSSPVTISTAGKHPGVQMPVGIVQPQSHTHAQKPNAGGVSVVTHQIGAKSVVGISGVQQHQNMGNPQLIHINQQQQQQSQVQQQQQQQSNQQTHISSIMSNKQGPQQLHISSGQQSNMIAGNQHIMPHAHQSPHPSQPTGAAILQAKAAHQQQVPSAKGVMGLHQTPQIMTAAVASPPLKQTHMAGQQPVVTGASSLRASVPPISPQGQPRAHMLQPGLPVAAFEANMGEGTFSSRGVPREHFLMYHQQYLRAQEALGTRIPYITRSPLLPGTNDQKELAEIDESMVASPPLELRRPGSGPRTIPVSHNLQSPQDRATDSPQVAQVYVHGTRIPHPHYPDVTGRYYENVRAVPSEPPPAHRSAHSVVASSGSAYTQQTTTGTPLSHIHSKVLEREQREREKERTSIPGHTSMPSHGSLVPAMPTPTGRNIQVATPPHASQVPPQADSLLMLLQRYPVMWQGLLALKTDQAAVQMHFVFGNPLVARGSLPCNSDGTTPPLRIAQRMRLEQTQLEGVAKKMQYENEHCMLLALPCGRDHMDVLQQSRNLQTGFITYLQQKMAAGIVNIPVPGSEQAAYVVHIFPSCDFANENLERAAPDLKHRVAEIAHLLIVIATV